ncbi:hypothetical protein, partial [Klebsiella michiganensis]
RDAKSGAARETRAGAKRGCLKQLCATTILKNADTQADKKKSDWLKIKMSDVYQGMFPKKIPIQRVCLLFRA